MATETITLPPIDERIQKTFEGLESQKTLINACIRQWKNLSDQFSSLSQTLDTRAQTLDSKIESLDSQTEQALESLDERESSIPDRESSILASIEQKKESAVKELEDPEPQVPASKGGFLRLFCRRIDSANLWRFMISHRKDLAVLKREITEAIEEAVDSCQLVIDAVEDFLNRGESLETGSGGDRCWAIGMLLRALFDPEGRKGPEVSERIRERAMEVAVEWKARIGGKEGGEEEMGGAEVHIFLQMVVAFGLSARFEKEELRKLVLEHATRKEMAKLAAGLGFGEKMADIIDELVKTGKELEAVCFACESDLSEKFAPAPLLKNYLHSTKKNASAIVKNGNHSAAATEEATNVELNAIRSIIKCVEYYKLEAKFSIEGLKKRLTNMERAKAERKKTASASKSQTKRGRAAGSAAHNYRPAKAVRTASAAYASYHNPPAPHQIPPARHSYNYPIQGYDGSAPASYGAAHTRSPSTIRQQYYMTEEMGGPRSVGVPYGGPQTVNYGGYDYAPPHAAPAQPQYPH